MPGGRDEERFTRSCRGRGSIDDRVFSVVKGTAIGGLAQGGPEERCGDRDAKAGCMALVGTVAGQSGALVPHDCRGRGCVGGSAVLAVGADHRRFFAPYYQLADLGYSYRYYTEPPPTPVITATLSFGEGRPEETLRLPGREVAGPRLRHQRQLALANALFNDVREAKERTGDSSRSRLARAYARHLCRIRPGCRSVTLHVRHHLIPDLDRVRQAIDGAGSPRFDLFAEELFTTPEWIGDFPCDSF